MKTILFYKFVPIGDPIAFQKEHHALCTSLGLKGKVLVASEGINGCVSGSEDAIARYKKILTSDERFADLVFKEGDTASHTFRKMFVRVRKEIITTKFHSPIEKRAPYLSPQELKEWYEKGEDFIIVDARNDYESRIGKFKNAIAPSIRNFQQWPEAVEELKKFRGKKIVTYCTGGIRCEKASAYMKEMGFENVFQLHGGILAYGKECGNAFWEGKCFVFDERIVVDIETHAISEPISHCVLCRLPSASYHNCAHTKCDEYFIACEKCHAELEGCCSKNCRNIAIRNAAELYPP